MEGGYEAQTGEGVGGIERVGASAGDENEDGNVDNNNNIDNNNNKIIIITTTTTTTTTTTITNNNTTASKTYTPITNKSRDQVT